MTELADRPFHVVTDAPTSAVPAIVPPSWSAQAAPADLSIPRTEHPLVGSWRSRHDPASREFPIRALLAGASVPVQRHELPLGPLLLQGPEGACPGFMAAHLSNIVEAMDGGHDFLAADDAQALYRRAQELDEWPGEDYSGSSVLAAMKAGQERDLWDGYAWSFGTRDIAQSILDNRPVGVGVPWLSGMFETEPDGRVVVTGSNTGQGHALAVFGIVDEVSGRPGPWFCWQNSQSADYGDPARPGVGYVHHTDLARLLRGVGEAAIPLAAR